MSETCEHQSLRRNCAFCDLDEYIDGLERDLAALRDENERLRTALQYIQSLDPASDSQEGYNEWGEAECFGLAQECAGAALAAKETKDA